MPRRTLGEFKIPFINGRYYANPSYGDAVERARRGESGEEINDEVLGPGTYDGPGFADSVVTYGTNDETDQPEFQLDSVQHRARTKQHHAQKQAHQKHPYVTVYPQEKKIGGSRSWRNNNPGNITHGPFAKSHGAIGKDYGGMAVFPTMKAGEKAQDALWDDPKYQALTIREAAKRWTHHDPPDVQKSYTNALSKAADASPDTPISQLSPDQLEWLKEAQRRQEGFQPGITKPIHHTP